MNIIEVQGIGKRYRIRHHQGNYIALRDILAGVIQKPFLFIKNKMKAAVGIDTKENFWALKDINFNVQKGEVIGIIGRNGAGKSTLLKILSQITPPTTGTIKIHGTVGSLLEVGTGFHPELSGRENIFLNGAILGMKRQEVAKKFDAIVEFAGIEKFLDTPVKYYSSGMYVRLAFSVAAHMEPDVLIIDEVLAVGDADFQKKCLGKMEEITSKEGRTILFVSHNMLAVKQLCTRSILLSKGEVKMIGKTDEVIEAYLSDTTVSDVKRAGNIQLHRENAGAVRFTSIAITNTKGSETIQSHDGLRFKLSYSSDQEAQLSGVRMVITVYSGTSGNVVLRLDSDVAADTFNEYIQPKGEVVCETEANSLSEGIYTVDVDLLLEGTSIDYIRGATEFEVTTDIRQYNFRQPPDHSVSDRVIKYRFK